ncbi:putative ABC transporter membrane protein [Actinacidiphila reveromycinica]|uniref:Transport permease protein n=1 Tax=Actinacidiphila reveromycinica TaxID=659352 RepID=A0A7U3UYW0_9ACTN|nr:ABC transporter permease [Streptomyces sp. SN-593]BBB01235.1 putative ABC transporter membrane protein [Streptomyces sp. SN-593]
MSDTTHNGAVAVGASPVPSAFDDGLSPAELAAKYGLSVSGARPGLLTYTRLLWGRRHFINEFAKARTAAQYTQARLGQLWQVMTPLLNAAVYYLIFGILIGTHRGIDNFIAFLVTGVFIFTFTQSSVLSGVKSISGNLGLIRALHFPRASMPIAFTLMQLQQLMMSMFVLLAIVLMTGEVPDASWLLMFPALLCQWVFNTGLALIVARLGSKMTDLSQLMPFMLRTWMYMSGVMYSITKLTTTAPHILRILLDVNPAAVYIDLMRFALIDSVTAAQMPAHVWPMAVVWALVVGVGGYVYFWKAEESYGRG